MKYYFTFFTAISMACANYSSAQLLNVGWKKTFGGPGNEIIQDIYPTQDGNYIILGITDSAAGEVSCDLSGRHDAWVMKIDNNGSILWQQCFGGSEEEANPFSKIIQTSDGGYLLTMETWSDDFANIGFHGVCDVLTIRLDANGQILWERCYGGSDNDNPRCILELPDQQFLLLMRTASSDGDVPKNIDTKNRNSWMIIIDDAGNILTNKIFGGTKDDDLQWAVRKSSGLITLFGYTQSTDGDLQGLPVESADGWLLVLNEQGEILKNAVYGEEGFDLFRQAFLTSDNGYMVFGETDDANISTNKGAYHGQNDVWMIKMTMGGKIQWQGLYGGSKDEHLSRVVKGNSGYYYLLGNSKSSDGDITTAFPGSQNSSVICVDQLGNSICGLSIGGTKNESFNSAVMAAGGVIGAGFSYSTDGDISNLQGTADGWVVRFLDSPPVTNKIENKSTHFNIRVSSADDQVRVTMDSMNADDLTLGIYNVLGQLQLLQVVSSSTVDIHTSFAPGIYFISLKNQQDNIVGVEKIIIN